MKTNNQKTNIKKLTFIALFGALGFVLMLLRFPLPFMPSFMDLDFSPVVEIMGSFMFGPTAGIAIVFVKTLLKFIIQGTSTFGLGELQNITIGLAYVLPASCLYLKQKTKKRAIMGAIIGTISAIIVAVLTNIYVIFPFYAKMMGTDMAGIIAMVTKVNPLVTKPLSLAVFALIPFNLIKFGLSSAITILLYKRLSKIIKGIIQK